MRAMWRLSQHEGRRKPYSASVDLRCQSPRNIAPSCDNRPLKFEEWEHMRPQTVYVSATPGPWELERTGGVFTEQVIRPTGLIDPVTIIRPTESQVDDVIAECKDAAAKAQRVLITTLTKRMAEDLTEYL